MSDVLFSTLMGFRSEIAARQSKLVASLSALENKDGEFASDHRAAIRMYGDVLDVVDRHAKKRRR